MDRFLEEHGYVEVIRTPEGKVRARRRSDRAELAFREALSPLRRDVLTAKIELGLEELRDKELQRYLAHAFGAIQVLLNRPPEIERAYSAKDRARRDPATWLAPPPFEGAPPGTYGRWVLDVGPYEAERPAREARAAGDPAHQANEQALSPEEHAFLKAQAKSVAAEELPVQNIQAALSANPARFESLLRGELSRQAPREEALQILLDHQKALPAEQQNAGTIAILERRLRSAVADRHRRAAKPLPTGP